MVTTQGIANEIDEASSIYYNNRVYELKESGRDVTVMSLGEAYFDVPLESFDDLPYPQIYHYSHSRGVLGLREKIAGYHSACSGVAIDAKSEILITAGSKVAIFMALLVAIRPGDEVLFSEPAWVSYSEQIKLCGGTPIGIPMDIPLDDFERFITSRTRVIIITNPHNPRGNLYSKSQLERLLALAKKYGLWLFSDEAYSDFASAGEFVSLLSVDVDKDHSVIFNSISKNHGMSGWRIGYLIANAVFTHGALKVNQHLITCPSTILQLYIERYFDKILETTKPQIESLVQKRKAVEVYMQKNALNFLEGSATFYFFVSIEPSKLQSDHFADRLLNEYAVAVVPGRGYGLSCDRYVRVSIGSESMDRICDGLACLKKLIQQTA